MPSPKMPSITNLLKEELRNPTVAFKLLQVNLEKIEKVDGICNCRYHVIFEAFNFFEKT